MDYKRYKAIISDMDRLFRKYGGDLAEVYTFLEIHHAIARERLLDAPHGRKGYWSFENQFDVFKATEELRALKRLSQSAALKQLSKTGIELRMPSTDWFRGEHPSRKLVKPAASVLKKHYHYIQPLIAKSPLTLAYLERRMQAALLGQEKNIHFIHAYALLEPNTSPRLKSIPKADKLKYQQGLKNIKAGLNTEGAVFWHGTAFHNQDAHEALRELHRAAYPKAK